MTCVNKEYLKQAAIFKMHRTFVDAFLAGGKNASNFGFISLVNHIPRTLGFRDTGC